MSAFIDSLSILTVIVSRIALIPPSFFMKSIPLEVMIAEYTTIVPSKY